MAGANSMIKASGERAASVTELKTAEGLRRARRQQGLSQVELADLLRISQSNISRWENGYESIPHRISLMLADILSGNRGRVHPFLRRLADEDQRISILQAERTGFYTDDRWLHLGENLARYFNIPSDESYMNLSSRFFEPQWRAKVFGSLPNDQLVSIEFERDCVRIGKGDQKRSCRLRSRQFVIDCEGYSKITLSVSSILGPATGEPPRILFTNKLSELGQLPPARHSAIGQVRRPRRKLAVPMMDLGAAGLAPTKV